MLQMILPVRAVNKNVIKKNSTKFLRQGLKSSFIRDWNVASALVSPKGINKYSMSQMSPECCLLHILLTHSDLVQPLISNIEKLVEPCNSSIAHL